jgi:hypothetical protein
MPNRKTELSAYAAAAVADYIANGGVIRRYDAKGRRIG